MLLPFECYDKRDNTYDHADNGATDREPRVAGAALHALALVGLHVDDVVLLQVIGWRVEHSLIVEQVDLEGLSLTIFLTDDEDIVTISTVRQVTSHRPSQLP